MTTDIFFEMHSNLPREGPGRNRYTRQAFYILPDIDKPRILDIGCGPGGQTMELARLTQGEVIGIDTHQPYVDQLTEKAKEVGLSDRVHAINCSMFDMQFPDESFDIIWAEGSIYITGFERGLMEWRRLIKPKGILAVHEMTWLRPDPPQEIYAYWKEFYPEIKTVAGNIDIISKCGYTLLGQFTLPEDAWWIEYYNPLEERINNLRGKYINNREALAVLDNEQREIDMYKQYYQWYGSVFFVMQKG